MKKLKGCAFALIFVLAVPGFRAAAQEEDVSEIMAEDSTEKSPISTPPPPVQKQPSKSEESNTKLLLVPLNSASLWTMGASATDTTDFSTLDIAKNPSSEVSKDKDGNPLVRPKPNSVYFGVPPKSAAGIISLGVTGGDVDRFLSTTAYKDTEYRSGFGYLGLDNDSLSVGVSRKFANSAVTSIYYNGNIIEDIFAYMANNSLTNGRVGLGVEDSKDETDYDFLGDLKDRNNINSRTNVNLMLGVGVFGINLGYSQKLFGLVKRSSATPQLEEDSVGSATHYNGVVYDTQEAILDNALAPNIEMGFRFGSSAASFRTALGFQVDIHQHRELSKGQKIVLEDFFLDPAPATTLYKKEDDVTGKLSADYIEPAFTIRLEADFPSDNRSELGIGLELGGKVRMYSNLDDKGETHAGIFWSESTGTSKYQNSITSSDLDLEILGRPSARYVTAITNSVKVGLSAGFGIGMKMGSQSTKTYVWTGKNAYMASDKPYDDANLDKTITTVPELDIALYPNLGVGFSFDIVRDIFKLNGGIGGTQTLYHLRTGKVITEQAPALNQDPVEEPLVEQSWGKPLGQLALGATFTFKENFSLDALFSTNGTSFDDANFVVQFSAKF